MFANGPPLKREPRPVVEHGSGADHIAGSYGTPSNMLDARRKAVDEKLGLAVFLGAFFPDGQFGGNGQQSVFRHDRLLVNLASDLWIVLEDSGVAKGVGVVELIGHLTTSDLLAATEAAERILAILAPRPVVFEGKACVSFPSFRNDGGRE